MTPTEIARWPPLAIGAAAGLRVLVAAHADPLDARTAFGSRVPARRRRGHRGTEAARYLGQWIIGTSLGLYFTPHVVREVGRVWWPLVLGAVFAIAIGYLPALRCAARRLDRTTAIFASVPGGAAEMAVLGERFGARVDRSRRAEPRILIVVAIIPVAFTGSACTAPMLCAGRQVFDAGGFALLMAATLVGSLVSSGCACPTRSCWDRWRWRFR